MRVKRKVYLRQDGLGAVCVLAINMIYVVLMAPRKSNLISSLNSSRSIPFVRSHTFIFQYEDFVNSLRVSKCTFCAGGCFACQ